MPRGIGSQGGKGGEASSCTASSVRLPLEKGGSVLQLSPVLASCDKTLFSLLKIGFAYEGQYGSTS